MTEWQSHGVNLLLGFGVKVLSGVQSALALLMQNGAEF